MTSCSLNPMYSIELAGGIESFGYDQDNVVIFKLNVSKGIPYLFITYICYWMDRTILSEGGEILIPPDLCVTIIKDDKTLLLDLLQDEEYSNPAIKYRIFEVNVEKAT